MVYLKLKHGFVDVKALVGVVTEDSVSGGDAFSAKVCWRIYVLGHFFKEVVCVCFSKEETREVVALINELIAMMRLNGLCGYNQTTKELINASIVLKGSYDVEKIEDYLVVYIKQKEDKTNESN